MIDRDMTRKAVKHNNNIKYAYVCMRVCRSSHLALEIHVLITWMRCVNYIFIMTHSFFNNVSLLL